MESGRTLMKSVASPRSSRHRTHLELTDWRESVQSVWSYDKRGPDTNLWVSINKAENELVCGRRKSAWLKRGGCLCLGNQGAKQENLVH